LVVAEINLETHAVFNSLSIDPSYAVEYLTSAVRTVLTLKNRIQKSHSIFLSTKLINVIFRKFICVLLPRKSRCEKRVGGQAHLRRRPRTARLSRQSKNLGVI